MADAIEYLRLVNWAGLTDAQGSAVDVPRELITLTSTDAAERRAACESLINRLVHAGSRYDASPHAVPYLLELVRQHAVPEGDRLFYLLSLIAVGEDYEYLSGSFDPQELRRRVAKNGGRQGLDQEESGESSASSNDEDLAAARIELASYDAVMRGVPLFCELLTSPDAAVRTWASCLLGYFPERAAEAIPHLMRMLEIERDPRAAGTAAISSGLIANGMDLRLASLLDRRLRSTRQSEVWGAAIGLAWCCGRSDRLVIKVLSECISSPSATFSDIPFNEGNIAALAEMSYHRILRI